MIKPEAPCLGCTDRKINCHSKCEKYLKFRKELDIHNAMVKEREMLDRGIILTDLARKRK